MLFVRGVDIPAQPAAPTRPPATIFSGPLRLTTVGLIIITTLLAFEAMAVATALPTAARQLHGLSSYGLAFTGFIVANIVGMVAGGVDSDRRGPRRAIVAGLVLFFAGLLLAGSATSMAQLLAGRVVQGAGSGLLITAMYVVIGERYDEALRPKVFGAMSSAWVVPSLVGPPVAGLVTEHLSWRWVFLALAPLVAVGAALLVPVLAALPDRRPSVPAGGGGLQVLRALVLGLAIAELSEAGEHPGAGWLLLAPVAVLGALWALRSILPPGTVRMSSPVGAAIAMRGLLAGAMYGCDALIPLAMSTQHGYSATESGLPLLVSAMFWSAGSWWQGRTGMKTERATLIRVGFALLAVACALAALSAVPSLPGALIFPAWSLAGLGAGLGFASFGIVVLAGTNDAERGRDVAALQLTDGVGTAVTTGFGGVLVAAAAGAAIGYTTAFVVIDLAMVAVAVVGVVVAGRVRPRRSASSTGPRTGAPASPAMLSVGSLER